jgi:hypothetical protein
MLKACNTQLRGHDSSRTCMRIFPSQWVQQSPFPALLRDKAKNILKTCVLPTPTTMPRGGDGDASRPALHLQCVVSSSEFDRNCRITALTIDISTFGVDVSVGKERLTGMGRSADKGSETWWRQDGLARAVLSQRWVWRRCEVLVCELRRWARWTLQRLRVV